MKRQNKTGWDREALGFTLIEILFLYAMVGFVIAGVVLLGGQFGRLLGGFFGFLAFIIVVLAWGAVIDFGFKGFPRLPTCRDGCCRGVDDYEFHKFGDDYVWVCRRGVRYRRRGRRFVAVNEDGTESAHLIWRPFRGWFPDKAAATDSSPNRDGPAGR